MTTKVAIVGSGNIGTDLMFKIIRGEGDLEVAAMVGIDPDSDGLRRAARLGVATTSDGVAGLIALDAFKDIKIIFDATSAKAHMGNAELLAPYDKVLLDLTPAAIGPFVVPTVNLDEHVDARNLNMVTCGGQATIPIVAAISSVAPVRYAEIVASIASRSAGPGTRANIDEFTMTTADALRTVGGAEAAKAIIILNPAEPPMIMRDTVSCLVDSDDRQGIESAIHEMVTLVAEFVPGYRLAQSVQFSALAEDDPIHRLAPHGRATHSVTVLLEVEGSAHYLPAYAGNLDIMTSAAVRVANLVAKRSGSEMAEIAS